ncbi:DUF2218 domain-containing protein [Halotalea alkalilenta]|uniref:2,4-dihydroxyhept-2-ene-1,7-dioic acid aldolase n=1 Tax=Halotalea alkalilenta TaxID=376489 RepID=A0A172YA41_9GAMM|nr:DUF2218 domain-containing protein [Halotalea alkalilenta]ANF56099.1 hypothetical protein A5892_00300 [Halotalea alkalilenta]
MPVSHALTSTTNPELVINKLKRHWAHKENLTLSEHTDGLLIQFSRGRCLLTTQGNTLVAQLDSDDEAAHGHLETVMKEHLERFSPRDETLVLEWRRG